MDAVKSKVLSIVAALENMDAEKDHIKAVAEEVKATYGIEPKIVKKVARIIHKNNLQKIRDENELLDQLLAKVV